MALWRHSIWPWLRMSPHSSLNVIYYLILIPDNDWALPICPVFLCKLNPIKAHWGTGSRPFSFETLATFPPQADHVLIELFSSMMGRGALLDKAPSHLTSLWSHPLNPQATTDLLCHKFVVVFSIILYKWKQFVLFCVELLSYSINVFEINHSYSISSLFVFIALLNSIYRMEMLQFVYLFACWRTFWLFLQWLQLL